MEGPIYGGKFAFQNGLVEPYSWKEIYRFCFVLLCISEGNFQVQAPGGAYIWRGLFSEVYGTPIIQFVQMSWSFLLKKRNTLLSVGIVFVKHALKFRKQYFFANLSFPRACNALDNSLNVTDFPLSNQTINI